MLEFPTRKEKEACRVYQFLKKRCCTTALAFTTLDGGDEKKNKEVVEAVEEELMPPCEGCTETGRPRSHCNAYCCPTKLSSEPGQGCIKAVLRLFHRFDNNLSLEQLAVFDAFAAGTYLKK